MSRPTPRRPSRTTTPRPRRIAGRPDPEKGGRESGGPEKVGPEEVGPEKVALEKRPAGPRPPGEPPSASTTPAGGGRPRGPLVAGVLIVLVGAVGLVLVGQVVWFVADTVRDDQTVAVDTASADGRGSGDSIAVPDGRPVVLDQLAVQDGVEAAARAATTMFARDWETYDHGVGEATDLMTAEFAEEYRATTDDVKQEFVAKKTRVEVQVVAQGVVRANDSELEALIFLNQYIFRGSGKDAKTVITPYRAMLTMVHTDQGWFVDDVQTK